MKTLIISCYTPDTPYEEEIKNLEASLQKFDLEYKFYPIKNTGDWYKNCQQKSVCILNAMYEFPKRPIAFLDADAVVQSYPKLFEEYEGTDTDFAFHYLSKTKEVLSGTLWFANNWRTQEMCKRWIELNSSNKEMDQKNLQTIIEGEDLNSLILNISLLPASYNKIFDNQDQQEFQPVIEQFQASRRFKSEL